MKTLAVLSAFVTVAIAAPAVEEYSDISRFSPRDFTISQQREKKSPTLETSPEKFAQHLEDHATHKALGDIGPSNAVARTFSKFKKPIIVKKKIGYQVYRDSEEEQSQLDPRENCRKEIKVKLCDDNNAMDKVKTASTDHNHEEISDSEMEHSINIAKEAVQTFERDLHKMELDCGQNHKHRQAALGTDAELHNDIEKARQAIEHIRWKVNNLDSDSTTVDEHTLQKKMETVKPDEDRMSQWKLKGNLHKNPEIGRNLEDNFKSSDNKDELKHMKFNHFNTKNDLNDASKDFKATIEDIDSVPTTNNKGDDGMSTIVEDKTPKMEIQSDSLIKDNSANDGVQEIEKNLSRMESHAQEQKKVIDNNTDRNDHETISHQGKESTKERATVSEENRKTIEEMNLNLLEKQAKDNIDDKEILKLRHDISAPGIDGRAKLDKEFQKNNLHTNLRHENDQVTQDTNHVDTILSANSNKSMRSEETTTIHGVESLQNDNNKVHLQNDNLEKRKSLAKDTDATIINHNEDNKKDIHQQTDPLHSTHTHAMPKTTELQNFENENRKDMDSQKTVKLNDERNSDKITANNVNNHINNENIPVHLRASSDFHRKILNNMDFIDDSHHMTQPQISSTKTSHMMNDKPELHERLNVPRIQPNSEHLKTMMHFSDNSDHENTHLKMSSMFNNEQPNFNVQFNSPQDFEEQTNIQELMPFKSPGNFHHNMGLDERFKTLHDVEDKPTEMHDPLKIRWSHPESMKMDGSSQHFNIEKLGPLSSNSMTDQHLSLTDQMRAQQQWTQAKNMNTHQLSHMNPGFEHLHAHDNFDHNLMMIQKTNRDSSMQPSSNTQLRGVPKMALEYANPSQWAHNHGAYRSSYGPGISASYGSGGGSSGGGAVGVFPNANVGNCAVPLLLSCSPSVVSGSLAKAQNAFSAPSYRSENPNFLKKRGVEIDQVSPGRMFQRNTSLGHKSNMIVEKNNETI